MVLHAVEHALHLDRATRNSTAQLDQNSRREESSTGSHGSQKAVLVLGAIVPPVHGEQLSLGDRPFTEQQSSCSGFPPLGRPALVFFRFFGILLCERMNVILCTRTNSSTMVPCTRCRRGQRPRCSGQAAPRSHAERANKRYFVVRWG